MKVRLLHLTDEARELLRDGSYDQAIAICRYILRQHPKYVEAYRILAEACLEKGDYKEAADLFKRVLGAAPHNFIAYVGLGIIHDEEGRVDEAIWQFERAFELSPANGEIRQMLKRLYERRDGVEPSRLKLNRAALGHLYAKGGLYAEAIGEYQEVLAQDPERTDIQLAMAEAYWHADNRRQAAEICQDILNKMPNCLKANLLLGEIWVSSGLEQEGETLLRRARNMDPEGVVAQQVLGSRSPLELQEIWIERPEGLEEEMAALEAAKRALLAAPTEEPEAEELALAEAAEDETAEALAGLEMEEIPLETELEHPAPEEMAAEEAPFVEEEAIALDQELASQVEALEGEELVSGEPELAEEELAQEAAAPEVGWDEEGESPEIAALEAEFGALPDLGDMELTEEARRALEESMPAEGASTEEILAWLEAQQQRAAAPTEEIEELPVAEEPAEEPAPAVAMDVEPEAEAEEAAAPIQEAEEEGESPIIAALEAEFGGLPNLDLSEISEDQRAAMEASMPPETASPEEIMAWLRQQGTLMDLVPLPEMPGEGAPGAEEEKPEWLAEFEEAWEEMPEPEEAEFAPSPDEAHEPARGEADAYALDQAQAAAFEATVAFGDQVPQAQEGEIEIEAAIEPDEFPCAAVEVPSQMPAAEAEAQTQETRIQEAQAALGEPVARGQEPAQAEEGEIEIEAATEMETLQAADAGLICPTPEAQAAEIEALSPEEMMEEEVIEEPTPAEVVPEPQEMAAEEMAEAVEAPAPSLIEGYLAALEEAPQDHATRLALAQAHVQAEDWEAATEQYELLARSSPNQLDQVIADLESVTAQRPELLGLQQVLGDAYMEAGRLDEALAKYNWLLTQV